jgi:hypothetical protein
LASNRDFGPIVPIRPQPADLEGAPGTVLLGFQLLASRRNSMLRAAWLRPKQTDLIPDKGQFR